eukprot:1065592_1
MASSYSLSGYTDCEGTNSCSNSYIRVNQSLPLLWVNCRSSKACASSTIISRQVRCSGYRSCENAQIDGAVTVRGEASFSLYNVTIDTNLTSVAEQTYVRLVGRYAGYGATLICRENHSCRVECKGIDSCVMFYVDCRGCTGIEYITHITNIPPTENLTEFNNRNMDITSYKLFDEEIIDPDTDVLCTDPTYSYDVYNSSQKTVNLDINVTVPGANGPICCRGMNTCYNMQRLGYESPTQKGSDLICSGRDSCRSATMINFNDTVYCEGYNACMDSTITNLNTLYCDADYGCSDSNFTNVQTVVCRGSSSCDGATFISDGSDLTIYFTGDDSGGDATVYCTESDTCTIHCLGNAACLGTTVYCTDCTPACDNTFTRCPVVHLGTEAPTLPTVIPTALASTNPAPIPTISPSGVPSSSPSYNPTIVPSNNPSTTPTRFPSRSPSEVPSASPSDNPSTAPTRFPSEMPTRSPSGVPTVSPRDNPSITPTHYPSTSPIITSSPTEYPSVSPSNFPSVSPSNLPSKSPSDNPTISPSKEPSAVPTIYPSKYPTVSPFASYEVASTGTKMEIIISITLTACDDDCVITEEKVHAIIIAELEDKYGIAVLHTQIIDNTVIVTLVADASVRLDKDVIARPFEAEYGEADVIIEEREIEDSGDENEQMGQNDEMTLFSWGIIGFSFVVLIVIGVLFRYCRQRKSSQIATENMVMDQEGENNNELIRVWLSSTVGLPQYLSLFIDNGYTSLEFISKISNKNELCEIGITIKGHQTQMMAEINQLRGVDGIEDNNDDIEETTGANHGNTDIDDGTAINRDIGKGENEPGHEDNSNSDNFDAMFVQGEESVSKSDQNKVLSHVNTEGADEQKFHGTKRAYYDEYHHQKYKERIKPKSAAVELEEMQHDNIAQTAGQNTSDYHHEDGDPERITHHIGPDEFIVKGNDETDKATNDQSNDITHKEQYKDTVYM